MAIYEYTALNPSNAILRGQVAGWTKRRAVNQLRQQQLTVVTLQPTKRLLTWRRLLPKRVSGMERIVFTRNLMTMLKAGMTLAEALASAREQTNNIYLQQIISDAERGVQSGQPLSTCLRHYPDIFNREYAAMITIGERSGKLVNVFEFLTQKMENEYRLMRKIKSAMTYPALILGAMVVIVTIMIMFVIPQVELIYRDAGVTLPIFTRALIAISHALSANILYIILGVMAVIIIYDLGMDRWPALRRVVHAAILRLPYIGPAMKKINLAVVSRSLAMLLHAGLTIDQALLLAADAARNVVYRDALHHVEPFVTRGVHLAEVFRGRPELFLPVFQRMVATGEQAGNLDTMFANVAGYYDDDLEYWSTNISSIIEPVMIIGVAVIVAGIAMAILFPLWNFVNVIS